MAKNSNTALTVQLALEVAGVEALVRQSYRDSKRIWTWCIGITNASGHNVDRYIGRPQTLQHCVDVWLWVLETYCEAVRKTFRGHSLTPAQFAAIVSFHYNTGAIQRATWVTFFKNGDMKEAEKRFMDWDIPEEIIKRRKKEADLLFRGKWDNDGSTIEYTRVRSSGTPDWGSAKRINIVKEIEIALSPDVETIDAVEMPLEPSLAPQPKSITKSTTAQAGAIAGVAAAIPAVMEISDGASSLMATWGNWIVPILAVVGIAAAVYVIYARRKDGQKHDF